MGAAAAARSRSAGGAWWRAGVVMLVVIALDQLTKGLVRHDVAVGQENEVLPGILSIEHVHNRGVAFGFLGGGGALVLVVTLGALTLLVGYFARHPERPLLWLPTGMLLGGALGNLIDRIRQGYVTDFITIPHWPSFNVADMSITLGVIVLVLVLERNARDGAGA